MLYKMQHYDSRTFLLYIDSYENDVPVGRYYNPGREEGGTFQSMTQLLLNLEQAMDEENMPQSFQKVRTFAPVMGSWQYGSISSQRGKQATFAVNIMFRRNASWQGSLTWLNKKQTMAFRSVLEFISLLNSALHKDQGPAWNAFRPEYDELAE